MNSNLERLFPNLSQSGYRLTSPDTDDYNCVAWAAGDDQKFWDPAAGYYWPEGFKTSYHVDVLKDLFMSKGYIECDSSEFQIGKEKIAIYGKGQVYEHV